MTDAPKYLHVLSLADSLDDRGLIVAVILLRKPSKRNVDVVLNNYNLVLYHHHKDHQDIRATLDTLQRQHLSPLIKLRVLLFSVISPIALL